VGEELRLEDFTLSEVRDLNGCYGSPLTPEQLKQLGQLLGGHPYLTARGLYQVASQGISMGSLVQMAAQEQGVFGGHLRHHRLRLQQRSELRVGMERIARGEGQRVPKNVVVRLEAAGLVRWRGNRPVPRCGLYTLYFRSGPTNVPPKANPATGLGPQVREPDSTVSSRDSEPNSRVSRRQNPWISGSFYLVVMVVVMTLVATIGQMVPVYVLPIVVIVGLLAVIMVGIFQLRQDDRFSEANVLILVQETLKRLPLLQ
jgi:hypothetical protein